MRVIIYGVGAVGGVTAAALFRSGTEVIGIARGAMLQAVSEKGLRLRTPDLDEVVQVPVVGHPSGIDWRADDVILLCVKGQDSVAALEDLRRAGVTDQPIFCAQNGIENERKALRRFPNVHGVTVMMPALYLNPGEVAVFTTPNLGIFDLGRYPNGHDADDARLAEILEKAGIGAFVLDDVMASKAGKLLLNLGNVLKAALGPKAETGAIGPAVRAEAEAAYRAAGIPWVEVDDSDPRRARMMVPQDVPGVARMGGSTNQSLLRGAERVEIDYLNGEIALLGRLHNVPVPLNAALTRLGDQLAQDGAKPGSYTLESLQKAIGFEA